MSLLLISSAPFGDEFISHIQSLDNNVKALYSSLWSRPPADFSFSLRYETAGAVPWADFDKIIALGGSRTCSLASEYAAFHRIPALFLLPHTRSLYFQAPEGTMISIPGKGLMPAFKTKKEDIGCLLPHIRIESFEQNEHREHRLPKQKTEIIIRKQELYRSGLICDLVSVACSEDTSSVSSSEALDLPIRELAESIHQSGEAALKRLSPLFAEFEWKGKRLMIYRQGRVSLSPCDDAEEVFFAYQFFINS